MPAPHPRMHGLTHVCGGPDPIPGICDFISGSGFAPYRECTLASPYLQAYFPMDDPSGDLADLVGGTDAVRVVDYDLVTYGLAGPFHTEFPARTAVGFGGTDGFSHPTDRFDRTLSAADIAVFNADDWAIESWIYPTAISPTSNNRIFSTGAGFQVDLGPTTAAMTATVASGTVTSTTVLALNTWTHWRLTYDGTNLRLYINGALEDTGPLTPGFGFGGFWTIGNRDSTGSYWTPFNGRISDVAVYSTALATFCATVTPSGPGSGSSLEGTVLTADGAGGTSWAFPTVNVDGARYDEILTGTNLTSTDNTDGTVTVDAAGGTSFDPATATTWWFPLVDSDGTVVLDADGALIPTLIPL